MVGAAPTKNSDILTAPLNQSTIGRRDINVDEGAVKMSEFIVTLNVRTEGLGIRATGRAFGKSHSTVIRWEQRLAQQAAQWSPEAPIGADVTLFRG